MVSRVRRDDMDLVNAIFGKLPPLAERAAHVFIENGMFEIITAQNIGLNTMDLKPGVNEISYTKAIGMVKYLDEVIDNRCPKYLLKRVLSFRNGLVLAFGPEMTVIVPTRKVPIRK
jgi:hypothetical protein